MTETLWLLAIVGAVLLAGVLWLLSRRGSTARAQRAGDNLDTLAAWQPQPTRILTAPERLAHVVLSRALPEHIVLAQVPLARFIRVPTRHSYSEWLRRVGQLSPDLLVCDAMTQVIAAVEVRPPSGRSSPRAQRRLERMSRVLEAAGIPLHLWTENALPSVEVAREAILQRLPEATRPVGPAADPQPAQKARPAAPPELLEPLGDDFEPDEVIEMREPPPSTWFDDLDTGPAPLKSGDPPRPGRTQP